MVRSMYPPLDPRLLEARAAALTLAVSHLALIARYECGQREKSFMWIDKSLAEMDGHMMVSNIGPSKAFLKLFLLLGVKRGCFDSRSNNKSTKHSATRFLNIHYFYCYFMYLFIKKTTILI